MGFWWRIFLIVFVVTGAMTAWSLFPLTALAQEVTAWGSNEFGETAVPPYLSGAIADDAVEVGDRDWRNDASFSSLPLDISSGHPIMFRLSCYFR